MVNVAVIRGDLSDEASYSRSDHADVVGGHVVQGHRAGGRQAYHKRDLGRAGGGDD